MKGSFGLLAALAAVVAAVFLAGDADLPLLFKSVPSDRYKDKVVWVVGASSGIGEFFAREVAAHGAKVVLSARRVDRLNEVAATLPGASVVPLDMLDYATHAKAVDQIIAQHGKIDIVVLNAGRSQRAIALDTEYEVTEAIMKLNFLSQIHLAKLIMPHFVAANEGHFVVVSSVSGKMGVPISSSYSASKFALHGYFDALRAETSALHNISVTLVCPGPVYSEIVENAHTASLSQKHDASNENDTKMDTDRCAHLMAVAVAHKMPEVWLSRQPVLLLTYINQYFPALGRMLYSKLIGPARVKVFKQGGNVYDFKAILNNKP